ncbi:MAG: hypothetical protein CVU70_03055 [Deltaproteobacteria bacterium HGW-Deltaproteobacteria-5]|nr:MAG: hypothetical protein CVU70_03055 [Deltaproteobacteria bacterium HGW-Deltaproteobacteria-5]
MLFSSPDGDSFIFLAWSVVRAGSAIIQAAPFKKGTVQVADIIRVSVDALKAVDLSYLLLMLLLVAALWILSIVDAYQLGKKIVTISTTRGNPE